MHSHSLYGDRKLLWWITDWLLLVVLIYALAGTTHTTTRSLTTQLRDTIAKYFLVKTIPILVSRISKMVGSFSIIYVKRMCLVTLCT